VAVSGHSGGAVRAVYAQATERFAGVNAVVAVSPGEYHHQRVIEEYGVAFETLYRQALTSVAEGQPDTYLRTDIPCHAMWTAQAFVDSFHPDNRYSLTCHVAGRFITDVTRHAQQRLQPPISVLLGQSRVLACTPCGRRPPPTSWSMAPTTPRCRSGWGMRISQQHGSTINGAVSRRTA
jgi:hypothetical protein